MDKKLKVKTSKFENTLTFNEWVEKFNVSRYYVEPTKYFQNNAGSPKMTMDTKMEMRFSSGRKKQNLLGKIISIFS